jgi:hypothetical protein
MTQRYSGHDHRPRSQTYNSRGSPPLTISSNYELPQDYYVIPSGRREVITTRSPSSASNKTVITTYKVIANGIPAWGSSVQEGSRSRRYTIDNHNRPAVIVTKKPRYRSVIHSGGGLRPDSSLSKRYRSREEESPRHDHHRTPVKEPNYINISSRLIYPGQRVKHANNIAKDYNDNEYGYTNPQDIVYYNL